MSTIQWYPGHIAKWDRALADTLKQVDVAIEVLDARLPLSTTHPDLAKRLNGKPRVRVLSKAGLAETHHTKAWLTWWKQFDETPCPTLPIDAIERQGKSELMKALLKVGEPVWAKHKAKGLKPAPLNVLVMGLPNVGKSTLINWLIGQKRAQTGHKAGVTRETRWIRVHPQLSLMDSPGTLPSKLDSSEQGLLLACVSSVGEAAFDSQEAAETLLNRIEAMRPSLLQKHYGLPADTLATLDTIAVQRNWLKSGQIPDTDRTALMVLKDFRTGRWGRLTLEQPPLTKERGNG